MKITQKKRTNWS